MCVGAPAGASSALPASTASALFDCDGPRECDHEVGGFRVVQRLPARERSPALKRGACATAAARRARAGLGVFHPSRRPSRISPTKASQGVKTAASAGSSGASFIYVSVTSWIRQTPTFE